MPWNWPCDCGLARNSGSPWAKEHLSAFLQEPFEPTNVKVLALDCPIIGVGLVGRILLLGFRRKNNVVDERLMSLHLPFSAFLADRGHSGTSGRVGMSCLFSLLLSQYLQRLVLYFGFGRIGSSLYILKRIDFNFRNFNRVKSRKYFK